MNNAKKDHFEPVSNYTTMYTFPSRLQAITCVIEVHCKYTDICTPLIFDPPPCPLFSYHNLYSVPDFMVRTCHKKCYLVWEQQHTSDKLWVFEHIYRVHNMMGGNFKLIQPQFCEWHPQIHFREREIFYLNWNVTEMCSQGPIEQ